MVSKIVPGGTKRAILYRGASPEHNTDGTARDWGFGCASPRNKAVSSKLVKTLEAGQGPYAAERMVAGVLSEADATRCGVSVYAPFQRALSNVRAS